MKPKIELGKEYPTRGGGKAIVYRNDGPCPHPLLGACKEADKAFWCAKGWTARGFTHSLEYENPSDILLPRTVMVPVEIPEWAKSVGINQYGVPTFYNTYLPECTLVEDWITSLEGEDD